MITRGRAQTRTLARFLYRTDIRQLIYQVVLVGFVVALAYILVSNAVVNLRRQNITSGFGFVDRTSGFDIAQHLIEFDNSMSYGRAFWVGLLNTLLVAALGIFFATMIGFVIGISRLSSNWVVSRLATVYVEVFRNIPPLLQLFFWYFGVLKNLPAPRQSLVLPAGAYLSVRGLQLPAPIPRAGFGAVADAFLVAIVVSIALYFWARRRQRKTGAQFPVFWASVALVVLMPIAVFLAVGSPLSFEYPELKGFNFEGGITVLPEFIALLLGLSIYTASFIAEIVRSGIVGVPSGQTEAGSALGFSKGQILRLIIIPQAVRIIVPPLTSQYLNLTKNSSLAVAIGYPDLVSVWAGTVLNLTGQAVEVITVTMAVYLTLSLLTSAFMNWFNSRMAPVER